MTAVRAPVAGALWSLVGAGLVVGVLGAASIGILVLPVTVVAAVVLASRGGVRWRPALAGAGAALLAFALGMEPYRSCSQAPVLDAGEEWSCGGLRREIVLVAGLLALAAAGGATLLERRRTRAARRRIT